MVINVISINIRGLRDTSKRRNVFNFYRTRCDVLCIQETHSTKEDEGVWTSEWGGRAFFSHGEKNSRGTATFINRKFKDKITKMSSDVAGRFVSLTINHQDENVLLTNIYGPNHDAPKFFEQILQQNQENCDKTVIIGDFNTVPDACKDRNNHQSSNNSRASEMIQLMSEELHMTEIWRARNPDKQRYSWYRTIKQPRFKIQASRIDYALVSNNITSQIHDTFYLNGLQTDHSAFFLGIDMKHIDRGRSYWKMNTTYLSNPEFVKSANKKIEELKSQLEKLNAIEKWDLFKMKMKHFCIEYSKRSASDDRIAISQLSEKITEMEENVQDLDPEGIDILTNSKIELEELTQKRTVQSMFRSGAKWAMEAERNTKYFFNLERTKYGEKTSYALIKDDGEITTEQAEIIELQRIYFQDLYTADASVKYSLPQLVKEHVDPQSIAASQNEFNEQEILTAIKGLKNGSCPGNDGFPIEFYKVFWNQVKEMIILMMNESYEQCKLPDSLRSGILNLIPKGNKDARYLKNLRPITLLNADYKIVEKLIANRMIPSLMEIIHQDQKGFLPQRKICANLRRLLDTICEAISSGTECAILSCDFMKCFDRIETECVIRGMEEFRFSEYLIQWVRIIYSEFEVRVQNNGHFSSKINVTRSVRQGGPASNGLFIVVAELLAIMLRENQHVEGIFLHDILQYLNQYADDLNVCMRFKEEILNNILGKFSKFERSTGFKLSYEKTTMYRTGFPARLKC